MAGIDTLITQIAGFEDLSKLFAALGYDPQCVPFVEGSRTIARWQGFRVAAIESDEPASAARALARVLGRLGERGVAVSLSRKCLYLAAPHIGRKSATKAYVVRLEQPNGEQLDLIESLRPDCNANALSHALRISELLGTEAAGEKFFRTFKDVLDKMADSLDKRHRNEHRRQVALLALTRILFLYFVQAKGWLNGEKRFLRQQLDRALAGAEAFHVDVLDPLFFGTLNQPVDQRTTTKFRQVPYLNGGLFEMHPIERRIRHRYFSNEMWRHTFDTLFERFRFCVREADEVDAIAPDMLGRVFERLMEAEQRSGSGTYYTPDDLVCQIVRAAIDAAVRQGVPEPSPSTEPALRRLREIRILDPACGSGAFLLGALDYLTELCERENDKHPTSRAELRRRILQENLFGVDIDPMAIRLAELRLWLAIIADDAEIEIDRVTPLPNLDGIVRQGDALMDPVSAARAFATPTLPHPEAQQVEDRRGRLFQARGTEYRKLVRELRAKEIALAKKLLDQSTKACGKRLRDLDALESSPDLFGEHRPLTPEQRRVRIGLTTTLHHVERMAAVLATGRVPFFAFEVHAPQPMQQGGFDVVVGNPPWVRAERLPAEVRRSLRQRFRWWQSTGRRGYAHLPDLALAFVERGLELTRPGGVLAFLVPSKIVSSGYGEPARQALVRETTIQYLHRIPPKEAEQFGATTYPLALVLKRAQPAPDHRIALSFENSDSVKQASLRPAGPWILLPDHDVRAIGTFLESAEPLSAIVHSALGVKTGADSVFVGTVTQRRGKLTLVQFASSDLWLEGRMLRPIVRGRDVKPFAIDPKRVTVWTCDGRGAPISKLPELTQAYLATRARTLRARVDYREGPFWKVFRTAAACARHRVVWPDLARRPRAVYLEAAGNGRILPLNTCYCAAVPSSATGHVVTAVLNSTWVVPYVRAAADEARGGYRRLNARVMDRIPIPSVPESNAPMIVISKHAHKHRYANQDELDEAVATALDLPVSTRSRLRRLAKAARH